MFYFTKVHIGLFSFQIKTKNKTKKQFYCIKFLIMCFIYQKGHFSHYRVDNCMKHISMHFIFRVFHNLGFQLIAFSHLGLFLDSTAFRGLSVLIS